LRQCPFPVLRNVTMHARLGLVLSMWFLLIPTAGLSAEPAAVAPKPGPKRAEFDRLLAEWKDLLAELATLQVEYRKADDAARPRSRRMGPLIEKETPWSRTDQGGRGLHEAQRGQTGPICWWTFMGRSKPGRSRCD
jgi:hypothetical protein